MKILVAEDDEVSRRLLIEYLTGREGEFQVLEAKDGDEAWDLLLANPDTALGIFDALMPGADGFDLLRRIRENPSSAALPVILCTSLNDRDSVKRALGLKVNQYLIKPFSRKAVHERIAKALGKAFVETARV
jgi:two-component system chemotaxis response regulator CheY